MKPTRETLRDLYQTQGLSCQAIGDRLGWSAAFIHKRLQGFGISTRPHGTNQRPAPEKPTAGELRGLYVDQQLSTRQIGAMYGVKHISVRRWLQREGITARAKGRGLANRGIEPPTTDELYRMVHLEHLSQKAIAARYGADQTAVIHWLRKHDIEPASSWETRKKHGGWKPPTEQRLRELYLEQKLSHERIGEMFGVASTTVATWLRDYGIGARIMGWNGREGLACLDGHIVRSRYEKRVDDWLYAHGIEHVYEPPLDFGSNMKSDFLANGHYIEVWGMAHDPSYQERRAYKTAEYKRRGMSLVELLPSDFRSDSKKRWERKLSKCLKGPDDASQLQIAQSPRQNLVEGTAVEGDQLW